MKRIAIIIGCACLLAFSAFAAKKILVHVIDQSLCTQCGECVKACKYNAIKVTEVNGKKKYEIDPAVCTQCGACVDVCPNEAIKVVDKKSLRSSAKDSTAIAKKTK
jgi:ferredoxin